MNPDEKKSIKKILLIATFCIVLFCALQNFDKTWGVIETFFSYLTPFLVGFSIAFIINVPMRFFERLLFPKRRKLDKIRRPLALILTFVIFVLILIAVYQIVVPEVVETIISVGESLPGFVNEVKRTAEKFFADYPDIQEYITTLNFNWQSIIQQAANWLQTGVISTVNAAGSAISGVVSGVIGFIFAIYVLFQKDTLGRQCRLVVYAKLKEATGDRIFSILSMANSAFSNFVSGQCLEACILGLIFALTMTIFQFPYMPLVSVLIAFTALIPVVGAFIGCIVGALLILMQDPIQAIWFVVMFIIVQQIEGNLIYPKVVGTSVGLPSIWVLVVVTVGGSMMGVAGMLLMIPLCSILYALFREYIYKKVKERGLTPRKIFSKKF